MTQSFDLAQAYVTALTGHPDTVMDWRAINDTDKGVAAHTMRGSIREMFNTLQQYNQGGWGIFVCINAMDGQGRELANVQHIRTHALDLDNTLTSAANYERAIAAYPQPHFAVQSSPNKFHLYWLVEPYTGNEFYTIQQRKLAQMYDGDKMIIDPTRVLRVPGFYHLKDAAHLVTCWSINTGPRWPVTALSDSLAHVNVINHVGARAPLGDPEMQAPSLDWLKFALHLLNPNELDRQEWMSISAAFKQSGWSLANEQTLLGIWQGWCESYSKNDAAENLKLWNSFRETEVGWAAFERRTTVPAYMMHYGIQNIPAQPPVPSAPKQEFPATVESSPNVPAYEFPELLGAEECKNYFGDCYFIARTGEIFSPQGRYMNSTQFNGLYGGRHFIITNAGKSTDEAWKAALRSTIYSIPKVDHVRFLPGEKTFAIIKDRMGRKGLNTYIPIEYDAKEGDVSLWLDHIARIMPDEKDRNIFMGYLAHCVKYPGHKIPWAPLFQSAEGVGKAVFTKIMQHALGEMYVYQPKAPELVTSGSKFNAWMRGKLCIIVDEIKVDERRELIEILKPMITDPQVEVQAKGVDQEMEDNPANWIFFSNHKDAIPISKNGRRYAVFYSHLQTASDIERAGLDDAYFNRLFDWLKEQGGFQAVTYWLLHYPIEKGSLPVRAPKTSTHDEALRISRSPMQVAIEEAIQDDIQGFRGGYVSSIAIARRVVATGVKTPSGHSIRTLLESMGYSELGRAAACYPFEDITARAIIYANANALTIDGYGKAQGYDFVDMKA